MSIGRVGDCLFGRDDTRQLGAECCRSNVRRGNSASGDHADLFHLEIRFRVRWGLEFFHFFSTRRMVADNCPEVPGTVASA